MAQTHAAPTVEAAHPPLPPGHSTARPLTLLLWDSPNMDMTLHNVCVLDSVVRPDFGAVTTWLCEQAAPGGDVEAMLFTAVQPDRGNALLGWIQAVRAAGFTVFVRSREGGDIDDAYALAAHDRLEGRPEAGTLILATHDQDLAAPLGDAALADGWRVVQVGFRESSAWGFSRAGWEFVDLEDVPRAFTRPLGRLSLDRLPPEGRWIQPTRPLAAIGANGGAVAVAGAVAAAGAGTGDLVAEVTDFSRTAVGVDSPLLLSNLGHRAGKQIPDFAARAHAFGKLTDLARAVVDRSDGAFVLVDVGTPKVAIAWYRPGHRDATADAPGPVPAAPDGTDLDAPGPAAGSSETVAPDAGRNGDASSDGGDEAAIDLDTVTLPEPTVEPSEDTLP
jgi:uncharacterized protein